MFEALRGFLNGLVSHSGRHFDDSDHRLAATALLIHVADADGELGSEEKSRLRTLVSSRFGLDSAEAGQLVREALESEHAATGVDYFTNVLKRTLDEDGRLKVVEMMWDIVYADGDATETEDSIVWRIAAMLDVAEKDMEILRKTRSPGHWPESHQ